MNAFDRDDIAHAINQVFAFYGKELDALQMKLWLRALSGLPTESIKTALADYTAHGRYAPKPVDIIEGAKTYAETKVRNLPAPEHKDVAPPHVAKAWAFVIRLWGVDAVDIPDYGESTVDEADQHTELCNRQAHGNNNPEAVPPAAWREDIWGCTREQAIGRLA